MSSRAWNHIYSVHFFSLLMRNSYLSSYVKQKETAVLLTHQPLRNRLYLNLIREVDPVVSFHSFVSYWTEKWWRSEGVRRCVRLLHITTNVKASSPCWAHCFSVQWYQEVSGPSLTTSQLQTVDDRLVKCIIVLQKAKEALKGMIWGFFAASDTACPESVNDFKLQLSCSAKEIKERDKLRKEKG